MTRVAKEHPLLFDAESIGVCRKKGKPDKTFKVGDGVNMASIGMQMTALGQKHEKCTGCGRQFARGEQMTGVEYEDRTAAGWFCRACVTRWTETGVQPVTTDNRT